MTEVDLHSEQAGKLLMMPEQDIIVSREGTEFWVPLLDPQECLMYRINGDLENQLQKCNSYLAINHSKHDSGPTIARHDEVCFGMTDPHPFVDRYGSFVYEGAVS